MAWYAYIAYFVAGFAFANSVPHFVAGISGARFQSPFADPPGHGESSSEINVLWGLGNFAVGYLLVTAVGDFSAGLTIDSLLVFAGALASGIFAAKHFSKVRS
jgi:hypothetical protein